MSDRIVFACSCEKTIPLDAAAIGGACGGRLSTADQLCGLELDRFRTALEGGQPVTVSCTLQAPLFDEVAEELGAADRVAYVKIRETAGWSREAKRAGPKIAALLAAAAEPLPEAAAVAFQSRGVALFYGRDEAAIEAGRRLAEHLDVTVLLDRPRDVAPPNRNAFPVLKGTIVGATGHLGAFELRIDDYALPAPSSRTRLDFGPARDGATSTCDLLVDLSGGAPLFPAHETRDGYLRADPRDRAAVERIMFEASHLVGEFDKPRFVTFHPELCAHSRSKITGCTRCLDVCPTGAIAPAGDSVAIDPFVCAGCGGCASVCPTGAAAYAVPPADALMRRLRAMMLAYRKAGGEDAIFLFHDRDHGEPLIDALARYGDGLQANILPVAVNEVTQLGPEAFLSLFAYGAVGALTLTRDKPKHDLAGLERAVSLAAELAQALGYGPGSSAPVVSIIRSDDPDALSAALERAEPGTPAAKPASFQPDGDKRAVLRFALQQMHAAAPSPKSLVPLAPGAPFGGLAFRTDACTLCLACVGACPTQALSDNTERPELNFHESLCVQCGLCAATCPEDVIGLKPQVDFDAWAGQRRVLKEEDPFSCIVCARPFGTKSTIERVIQKLHGQHWMFAGDAGDERIRLLQMCEDCRVEAALDGGFDPHEKQQRANPRTSEDYLRERAALELEDAARKPALSEGSSLFRGSAPGPRGPRRS